MRIALRSSALYIGFPLLIVTYGCASAHVPSTLGAPENARAYGYHPVDPLPVLVKTPEGDLAPVTSRRLLSALPDETMRIAIGQVEHSGNVTFGPAKTGIAGNSYVVVLDYIKFQTRSFEVEITDTGLELRLALWSTAFRDFESQKSPLVTTKVTKKSIVPVYVGVGLRLTATVTVNKGSVDLGNLFALGVAAQANRVTGTMVVQTLGVSGQTISTLIPMPGEINPTTIQNAILALGAIKAKLYDDGTDITPRRCPVLS